MAFNKDGVDIYFGHGNIFTIYIYTEKILKDVPQSVSGFLTEWFSHTVAVRSWKFFQKFADHMSHILTTITYWL